MALEFLGNPQKIWVSEYLNDKQTVLKLAFAGKLAYARNEGFRTVNLSLPFKWLGQNSGGKLEMARPTGFEPVAPGLGNLCSILLSYGRCGGWDSMTATASAITRSSAAGMTWTANVPSQFS